jgi:UDP-N-acetylmuramoyl-L-alanyl-D-glutamate--2,6-diaminopimelate ligase
VVSDAGLPTSGLAEAGVFLTDAGFAVEQRGDDHVRFSGITLDSRRVERGNLYAALPGSQGHGADFADQALAGGAVAVLTDPDGADRVTAGTPLLVVTEPRRALGVLAAHHYGQPARALTMIGVTGTHGKTTVTRLIEAGLTGAGVPAGVIGTVGTRILGEDVKSALTTPEAPDLQALFARMRTAGVEACAMEVSSHALVMERVGGIVFDLAVFTNLGRDHLDFHADMEDYFAAKARLFTPARATRALVNVDDEWGRRLVDLTELPVSTMSTAGRDATWRAGDLELSATGSRFRIDGPDGSFAAGCPIPGDFNVANTLAAVAACAEVGYDGGAVADAIARSAGVPGRLERIDEGQDFAVVVDYAHKPDAVHAALATLRPLTEGRVIVVIGAGGDRDPGKRPLMGEIAAREADLLIVTDDNPRREDPAAIRSAVLAGAAGAATVLEIGDRRAAIAEAIGRALAGDIVLIAGKGHETGQEIAGVVHPFDDRSVAREELTRCSR